MLVHLVGSLRDLNSDAPQLKKMIDVIYDNEATLAFNWFDPALIRIKEGLENPDWTSYVQHNIDALRRSDVVVIDATHYTFSHGFQMAAALEFEKPILVLSRDRLEYKYITGFTDPLLLYKTYTTEADLVRTLTNFLRKNTVHTKDLRFNIMFDRKIAKYLDKQSLSSGKSKSDIIRDVIKKKAH
jgi:hypothetical protein